MVENTEVIAFCAFVTALCIFGILAPGYMAEKGLHLLQDSNIRIWGSAV